MSIFHLSDELIFPDPKWASTEGLLAIGGDLSVERLLLAYRHGIFPWYGEGEPILWWSPDPRCVLIPSELYVSSRLQRVIRQQRFRITCNCAFEQVVNACAAVRVSQGEETWLLPEMQEAYQRLHALGFAHSVEAWLDDELVGGLYGVAFGRFFFGESMFHRQTNASKVVLAKLVRHLRERGFQLLDCQVPNPHLLSMGAVNVSRENFLAKLKRGGGDSKHPLEQVVFPAEL